MNGFKVVQVLNNIFHWDLESAGSYWITFFWHLEQKRHHTLSLIRISRVCSFRLLNHESLLRHQFEPFPTLRWDSFDVIQKLFHFKCTELVNVLNKAVVCSIDKTLKTKVWSVSKNLMCYRNNRANLCPPEAVEMGVLVGIVQSEEELMLSLNVLPIQFSFLFQCIQWNHSSPDTNAEELCSSVVVKVLTLLVQVIFFWVGLK